MADSANARRSEKTEVSRHCPCSRRLDCRGVREALAKPRWIDEAVVKDNRQAPWVPAHASSDWTMV